MSLDFTRESIPRLLAIWRRLGKGHKDRDFTKAKIKEYIQQIRSRSPEPETPPDNYKMIFDRWELADTCWSKAY